MRTILIAGLLAGVVATAGLATSTHGCNGDVTTVETPAGTLYLDDRSVLTPTGFINHWVYLESNGVAGLQSGGVSVILGDLDPDPCSHLNPDTLIV